MYQTVDLSNEALIGTAVDPMTSETSLDPNDGDIPLVRHERTEECIYVLEGEVEITLGEDRYVLSGGDTIYFDGPMLNRLRAQGDRTVRYLAISTPPIF